MYFGSLVRPEDVCLFEIIDGFGPYEPDPDDADLFAFSYFSTPGFPLPAGVNLRMILTNPKEFE